MEVRTLRAEENNVKPAPEGGKMEGGQDRTRTGVQSEWTVELPKKESEKRDWKGKLGQDCHSSKCLLCA